MQAQSDYKDIEKQRLDLERALQRYKEDLDREARYRQVMEERWQGMAEDYEKKVGYVTGWWLCLSVDKGRVHSFLYILKSNINVHH